MIEVLVITTVETVQADVREIEPTLDGFKAVIGGWLEGIGDDHWRAYCDEEGKIKGLPVNIRATRLARTLGWLTGDVLCGPVVFMGPPDEEGMETAVPGPLVAMAATMGYVD